MTDFGFHSAFNTNMNFGFSTPLHEVLTPNEILGTTPYDWWDYTDLTTQSITSNLINSITSKGTSTNVFTSSGTARPQSVIGLNGYNVASFDGVNDFMEVLASTSMFNFIHNGSPACVIIITNKEIGGSCEIIGNIEGSSQIGFRIQDPASEQISLSVGNGTGSLSVLNASSNTATLNLFNLTFILVDSNASPVIDRAETILNDTSTKSNVQTATPSVLNATNNLVVGKRAFVNDNWLRGEIAEILIIDSIPTPTQITQLSTYFKNKYGGGFPRG